MILPGNIVFLFDLYKTGLHGRLPLFIYYFVSDHYLNVCARNIYSDVYSHEARVRQGSSISVILFSLKINSIVSCLV